MTTSEPYTNIIARITRRFRRGGMKYISTTSEIKSCAHCGGRAWFCKDEKGVFIQCDNCGIRTKPETKQYGAFDDWNARTPFHDR
jgi:hypothetical protein